MQALKNYVHEQHRYASRRKRAKDGSQTLLIDSTHIAAVHIDESRSPEEAFSSQWGATLIRQTVGRVHEQCLRDGLETHWQVFEFRVVRPMVLGGPPTAYKDIVQQLELKNLAEAANMMVTVKRRFARALVEAVAETVSDPLQVNDELRSLLSDLERA